MESITLNIRYDLPDDVWEKIGEVYSTMPGWKGYINDNCPVWESSSDSTKSISASVEPSGLVIEGNFETNEFNNWVGEFCQKTSELVGYEVKDAEL